MKTRSVGNCYKSGHLVSTDDSIFGGDDMDKAIRS